MTTTSHSDHLAAEQFARKLTAHLSAGEATLPYVVTERLRASREQAISQRRRPIPLFALHPEAQQQTLGRQSDGTALLGAGGSQDNTPLWVRRVVTALPILGLACALAFISADQDSRATIDVAELDAALLTSELPPAAYTDAGFLQYLQTSATDTP
ncbi:MAG: DUF3619 family protein [Comamonas sp.]|jgi:hypothetical protein|nr:DUF3619 family protein [Comamonas sp.]